MTDNPLQRVVLNIPHAAWHIPDQYRDQFIVPDWALHYERLVLTDWYTQELFNIEGARQIVANVSRVLVDTERFASDDVESMAQHGMGAIYTHGSRRQKIRRALTDDERRELLTSHYHPHYQNLQRAIQACLDQHNECFLIDCHSFWNEPMAHESDKGPRPDFCIGTNVTNAPEGWVAAIREALAEDGASVAINTPYSGCMLPSEFAGDPRVKAAMIEINRKLYMNIPAPAYGPDILDSYPAKPTRTASFSMVGRQVQTAILRSVTHRCTQ